MLALPPAMSKQGGGLAKFIANPSAITKAMDIPAAQQTVDVSAADVTPKPTVAPKALPAANLVPDPVTTMGVDPDSGEYLTPQERKARFKATRDKAKGFVSPPTKEAKDIEKVDTLEDAGVSEDDTKKKVKKDLEDEFKIDPKMKKAFMDALALPVKSAAVAITDLLEKIPAPSKEASKILNRNISKISQSFKLGAASAEVANDEEDNDKKEEGDKDPLGVLVSRAFNLAKGAMGGGGGGEGEPAEGGGGQLSLPAGQAGDPTHGRRAPYTGTADGIGLGDGSGRSMQPIKARKSGGLAKKLFGMTPMGMAFNAGNTMFKGAKSFTQSKAFNNIKNIGGKALGMTPMGMMAKFMMKGASNVKNLFSKGEQTVNLTELTDQTIQENRESADAKTQKSIDIAAGTGAAMEASTPSPPPYQQEGGALAQPNIEESPYLDVYNTTSQF